MRKNNHHSIPTTEVKSRVKMWRSGKNWVYGLLFFFGMAGISFGQANLVHADTTELSTETEKGTIASQLTDRAVPLQTSISKSADDSTNTAISDSEPDISGTNAKQTDATVEPSTAEATGSDTTDKAAPATDSESTTAGDQTESATTESPVSDPVNLSTTDSTDTTGATTQADSSTATKSDATPDAKQTDSDTASSSETASSSDTATTTSLDETDNTETPTTDQTESSASSETSTNSETPVSDDSTAPMTEDASSNVDTSSTPLPEVSYKSMFSAEQVATLAGTSEVSSALENTRDLTSDDSTTDEPVAVTDPLPDGFSVTDPTYPTGTFFNTPDSGMYSFFEGTYEGVKVVLSTDRSTATHIYVQKVSGTTASAPVELMSGQRYSGVPGFTIIDSGPDIDSVFVLPAAGKMVINYEVYSYRSGSAGPWGGYAVLKPLIQTQTTTYVDQKGKEIAPSVKMQGLSGQNYTTGIPATLSGYEAPIAENGKGFMSPFMTTGQSFREALYNKDGSNWGILTYTLTDVDKGSMDLAFKLTGTGASGLGATTLEQKQSTSLGNGAYTVPNIYIPQTTIVPYVYNAESATVPVTFVDENGNKLTPDDPTNSTLTMLFNEATPISPVKITGYTYNTDYQPTANDDPTATHNPETYTVTDIDNPGKIILHYIANDETLTVRHVDANKKSIGTDTTFKGKFGQSITIDKTTDKDHWNIYGYKATNDSVSYTFSDGPQTVEVPYTQVFTAPIHYVDNSGNAIDPSLLTDAPQTLSGDKGENVEFTSPTISGYTAFSDNPTSYTLSENDTTGVTLRYVPTTVDITWETPAGSDTPVLTSNAGTPVAGQPISADDPTGPKWPTSLTTPGLDDHPQDALGQDGMVRTVLETVNQYISSDLTKMTTKSSHYVYFRRSASIDFSNPTAPSVKFSGWEAFAGPDNTEFNFLLGSEFYPASDYMAGVDVFQFNAKTQIAKAFDANGNPIALADIDAAGQTVYGLPAVQVTADTPNLTYNIVVYPLDDLQRTFTRTVNFVKDDGQPIPDVDPVVQTVTATREPTLDFSNPTAPKATGYSDWTLSANEFTAVPATAISGYLAPSSGIDALGIDVDTTPSSTTATLTYTPITGTYTITTPEGVVTENHWTTDPDDPSKLAKVTVPTIENYTPVLGDGTPLDKDPDTGNYIIPVPTEPNAFVNITYHEDTSSVTVDFTDYTDSSNAPWPSQTFSGEPGKPVKYSQDKNGKPLTKYREGYLLLFDGTLDAPVYGSEAQTVNMGYMPVKGNYEITPTDGGTPEVKPFAVDPETPTQYLQQTIPVVEGYTAVIDHGDNTPGDIEVDPDDPTQYLLPTPTDTLNDVKIKYIADQQQLTVHFKMPAGSSVPADVTLTGESGSDVVYTDVIKSIADYVYVPSESDIVDKFDYDSSKSQTTTLVYKAVGDYTYTTPGTDTPTTTTYTTDQDNPSVATGTVPYVDGYEPTSTSGNLTPVKDADGKVTSYTFTPTDPTQPAEIKYDAKKQNLTVYFETADETKILGKVTLQGASGGPIDYSTVNKQLTGFILQTDGTLSTTKYDTDDDQDQSVILTYAALGDGVTVTTPTGEKTITPYTNDSTEPKDPKAVDPITISYVPGYTPSSDNGDVTPVKDPEGNITGYTLIPTYPTKSTSVTYDADSRSIKVAFVDNADKKEIAGHSEIELLGVTDGTIDYTKINKLIDGYILVSDGTKGKTTFSANDDGTPFTILYNEIGTGVTLTTPDPDDPNGQQTTKTYTNNPTDPSTVLPIDVPYIPGYTPSTPETVGKVEPKDPKDLTKGYTFTPSNPSQSANVKYNADKKSIKVAFVNDEDKQEIAGHPAIELLGVTDETIDYTKINKLIDGYVLVNDGIKDKTTFAANDDGTPFTILYNEIGTGVTLTTPDPDDPNGRQTTKTYTNNPENPSTVLPIDVSYIPGYTPSTPEEEGVVEPKDPKDLTKGYTFTPKDPAQPANVKYNADSKNLNVVFVDQADPETPLKPTQNLIGVTDGDIDYTTVEKVIDGYVLLTDETAGKTKFTATDNGEKLTLTYQKTAGGYVGKTPTGVDLTTPYVTDPEDPKTVQPITIPTVPGYTLDIENGKRIPVDDNDPSKGYTVTPINPSEPTTVTYTAETGKSVQVAYVDENGVEIAGHPVKTFSGQTDQTIDYGTKAIAGYVLTADGTKDKTTLAADDDGTHLTISYEKIVVTITKPTDDGNTETVPVDTTTPGHVDYIPGYTPKTDDGTALDPVDPDDETQGYKVPVPDDPTTKTTVNYDPDVQTVHVVLVDTAHHPVTNDEGQSTYTFHGVTGEGIHEWEVDKKAAAYTISDDGTLQKFVYDNDDAHDQVVEIIYLKTTAFNDPDGGTTTLLTDGSGKVVSIDKKWGTDGGDTNVLIENGIVTLTPNTDGTPIVLTTNVPDGDGTVTGTLGGDGNIILTKRTPTGTFTETITPDGQLSFSQAKVPEGVTATPEDYFEAQTTHDPDGGTTTTKTNGNGDITAIDRNWPDGDHSHIVIDIDTGIATITETPAGGSPSEPVAVQPGTTAIIGKTTLDNHDPINLTHAGTDGDSTIATITPEGKRTFTYTHTTDDPDGGKTTTTTNTDGDITTIDKDWGDGDHSHVDIDTGTGIATITETPAGGSPSEPLTIQPSESGKNGKTTLDNGEPDGNIVLTHPGTDGDSTIATITPDGKRTFTYTHTTDDPDGGKTTTTTNTNGKITTIDKDWGDGDHSHVDIDTDTGVVTFTETPAGGSPSEPLTIQPSESGKNGKTTLDNGEPDGNIVLTHPGTDGGKTTETITPDTSRSFGRQPAGVQTTKKDYFETQITHDPDGGTTTTKTNGDDDITTIDKGWSDGDHSHVDINPDTGIATITETPKGGSPSEPITVQPGESGKNGKTTLDNGEPDGNIVLTHQDTDGDKTTETITPDTSRSFSRQPGGVSTDASHYFETQVTHDPDGGTTTTKTNGDGNITTIDKDWSDGDHSHVDIETGTGIATITETPAGGSPSESITVQPGESGKNGKTTLDNGEPDGNIVLTHQDTDGDKTTETITPDTSRSFSRQPGGVSTDASHYFETQITHDPDGGTTTIKTNGDDDITTIDKDWGDGDHSHVDIDTGTGIATITETPNGGEAGTPVEVQTGESGKNGKTTLDNGEPDGNIVLTHQDTDGDKTTETIAPDTSRSFSRQPAGVQTTKKDYFETQITHDPDGGTTTTKTNGDGDITTIDKDWGDGDHSHVDIDTDTGIATITETPAAGSPSEPIEVQPGESGKNGKTTLDNGEPDGNIVLTHQDTDGDKTTETITPDTSRSFSRQPGGVSTDASHYYETQVTHDPDGGTTTTKINGDGDITTIDKGWSDGDHSHVDIDTDTGIATITETPNGGEAGTPVEVQPGESGKSVKTTLDNGEPDGNIVLTHQGTDGDKTTETIAPDTTRSFSRQPGGVSTDASHYYTTQVTHDPDGGTTTTKTNGNGDITTIDKDWGDGDHSHVDIDTDTGIATITETPNGGEAGTPIAVQPGESGKNGKTTLDNGEPDGNIVLTHQGTDGDKTTETIMPDTSRSFSRMPAPVFVTADDFYDTRTTHDSDGGTTTTVTNGNGDVTTIDKDWGDGSHTHVTVDPNTGDATATDTDANGNTSTPVTVKPGETGTTGQTTITNGRPDGDIILSHEGTDGDQVEATISDDGHVRVSLPDTDAEAKAETETNVAGISTPGSTTSANHTNLPQTSATSRTDVQGKKSTATQLPETGDKQNGLGLIGATLLAGLAMLGFGKRRRDDED